MPPLRQALSATLLIFALLPAARAEPLYQGSSEGMPFEVETLATGLGIPWSLVFIGPQQLLFTERDGGLGVLNVDTGQLQAITGAPEVRAKGQGGLLDVATTPDYRPGDWLYFTYSKPQEDRGVTALARARLDGLALTDWEDLVVTRSATGTDRHYGSRIAFDGQGHLFFTVGDRGKRPNGQDLTTHAGAVLRVTLEGEMPDDNPFLSQEGALAEIWSYGHRNPQGIAYDAANDRLWEIEHGPRGGDEINLIERGENYGWPVVSQGKEYWGPVDVGEADHRPDMKDPVKVYIPSIAPGSLLLYTGDAFPAWKGNLFAGALKLTHLNRITLNEAAEAVAEERLLETLEERIRALAQDARGWLYLSTDSGSILRLRPVQP
ncbi:PQQ-dependent sugar dehydrogenase [Motiliproteus sp. SC1-56]|uniref:PQQ-dependent sugar dehydrogenase n=1 Tax=Motiliproteus sp. SC1-56 TaxID=2799565 RepID=UPI001A8F03A2|nr:PQQ-dependent sugar dehydrogenase [Motiliproteus sp. SC1-56]